MPHKKNPNPGTVQFDKLIAEPPGKRENIKTQIEFRHDLLESHKQGAKRLPGLDANAKSRVNGLQKKATQSLNGSQSHRIYSTKFLLNKY